MACGAGSGGCTPSGSAGLVLAGVGTLDVQPPSTYKKEKP